MITLSLIAPGRASLAASSGGRRPTAPRGAGPSGPRLSPTTPRPPAGARPRPSGLRGGCTPRSPTAASLVAPAAVQRDPIQPPTSNLHSNRRKVEVDARLVSTEMCITKLNWIPVWIRLLVTSNRLPAVLPVIRVIRVIRQIRPIQEDRPPEGAKIHTGITSKHYFV